MKRAPSTLRHDARRHDVRAVTYAWHPLHGREFAVEPHGNGDLFRCSLDEDRGSRRVLLPQWIFDPVACSGMREVSAPVSCLPALDELRRVLLETHALDSLPASGERRAHEETPPPPRGPNAATAFAHPRSGMEQPPGLVPRRGRRTARQASAAARPDNDPSGDTRRTR